MDVEASTAVRQAEVTACKRMIARVQDPFGVWPERLAADTAYGSAEMLAWLVHERGIHPHIPVFAKSARRDGTFERDAFPSCDEAGRLTSGVFRRRIVQPRSPMGIAASEWHQRGRPPRPCPLRSDIPRSCASRDLRHRLRKR